MRKTRRNLEQVIYVKTDLWSLIFIQFFVQWPHSHSLTYSSRIVVMFDSKYLLCAAKQKQCYIHLAFDSMNICMAKQTHHCFKPNAIKNTKIYQTTTEKKKFFFWYSIFWYHYVINLSQRCVHAFSIMFSHFMRLDFIVKQNENIADHSKWDAHFFFLCNIPHFLSSGSHFPDKKKLSQCKKTIGQKTIRVMLISHTIPIMSETN